MDKWSDVERQQGKVKIIWTYVVFLASFARTSSFMWAVMRITTQRSGIAKKYLCSNSCNWLLGTMVTYLHLNFVTAGETMSDIVLNNTGYVRNAGRLYFSTGLGCHACTTGGNTTKHITYINLWQELWLETEDTSWTRNEQSPSSMKLCNKLCLQYTRTRHTTAWHSTSFLQLLLYMMTIPYKTLQAILS